ncbi:hypothetical protein LCGC14_1543610 [marine sediment metagenome]|uniref:Swiss Army Knife 2H phosphoesterase domain-containing protein n=1 Tax=marine sediment metagenome TaxID=412755 RepID=A0A0F9JDB1_9ZZZZ
MKIIKTAKYKINDDLREKISELEHKQWMHWAKDILKEENISKEREERWKKDFISYKELSEEVKDFDRDWADKVIKIIKTAKYAQLKEVKLRGILKKTKDNFVYLDISNDIINGFISILDDEGINKPPYNLKSFNNVGAHISVIGIDEYKNNEIKEIKEIGQEFNFVLKDLKTTNPKGWDEMKKIYFLRVDAPELEELRNKYKLSKLIEGHDFHITIGVEKK